MDFVKRKKLLKIRKYTYELFFIILGSAIMASGTSFFLLPNQLSSGGFSGIATIFYYLIGTPMGTVILALNAPLIIFAYFRIGKGLVLKTILGTFFLSLFIDLFNKLSPLTEDRFLGCIYGGIVTGIGSGLILKVSASTGGTDLLSYIIRSFRPYYKASTLIVIVDTIIVGLNVIFFKDIEVGLYSAITIYLMGKMIDIIFEGVDFTKVMYIISDKYSQIAKSIGKKVNRGSTGIYAKGMFKNDEKMMLFCVGSRGEVARIKQIALNIDNRAFIVVSNARETFGKGFKLGRF